jgi:predicted metal-dependent peptidase
MSKLHDKKGALESALFYLVQEQPFYGSLLQELNIIYTEALPTAAIAYNKKLDLMQLLLNPEFFCTKPIGERKALLMHEILHFCHQHIWRYQEKKKSDEDQSMFNMAADMAINQYIQGLPKNCVDVANFKLSNGEPFPKFKTMEYYWELLEKLDGKDAQKKAGKSEKTPNQEELEKYLGKPFDVHDWEELSDDDKQKMLEEAKRVIKRTIEKSSFGHNNLPDSIKSLIEQIEAQISGINYKAILKNILKRTICSNDRENTWNKPSKRYGIYSQGTRIGRIPNILFLVDTSGSISHTEICEFFKVVDGFLKLGQKTCKVGFWHTDLYKIKKYKTFNDIKEGDIEAGGTDPNPALKYAEERKPDLVIILTDGYFSGENRYRIGNVLWCISKTGNVNHPYKEMGKTLQIK